MEKEKKQEGEWERRRRGGGKEKEINCYLLIMTAVYCISLNGIYCYLKNVRLAKVDLIYFNLKS